MPGATIRRRLRPSGSRRRGVTTSLPSPGYWPIQKVFVDAGQNALKNSLASGQFNARGLQRARHVSCAISASTCVTSTARRSAPGEHLHHEMRLVLPEPGSSRRHRRAAEDSPVGIWLRRQLPDRRAPVETTLSRLRPVGSAGRVARRRRVHARSDRAASRQAHNAPRGRDGLAEGRPLWTNCCRFRPPGMP